MKFEKLVKRIDIEKEQITKKRFVVCFFLLCGGG